MRNTSPLAFCITGFGWLIIASILGLAMLIGLVRGTPVPQWVRTLHVHAVLVGGVVQIVLGGLLLLIPSPPSSDRREAASHPLTFWAMNVGLIGMLVGFWLGHDTVVAVTGLAVIAAYCLVTHTLGARTHQLLWKTSFMQPWHYIVALVGLLSGTVMGEIIALGLVPQSFGHLRLAHIHLVVLGFVVLTIIGMVHHLLPMIWDRPPLNSKVAQIGTVLILIGVATLISGFFNSSISIELAAGAVLFIGGILWTGSLFRTWLSSNHTGSAASDHLFVSAFFLIFTIILGSLVGANRFSDSPVLPYGKLHLIAYTHMAFLGFIMNAVMGVLSHFTPILLATGRSTSIKKRGPYLDQLNRIMDRGRATQISSLSLGTMGLGILAALTWNVPLTSLYVRIAMWTCFGLLLTGMVIFAAKLTAILTRKPEAFVTPQRSTDELKLTA